MPRGACPCAKGKKSVTKHRTSIISVFCSPLTTSQHNSDRRLPIMAMPGTETIRFRRPTAGPNAVAAKKPAPDGFGSQGPKEAWKRRHQGLLQDQVGR